MGTDISDGEHMAEMSNTVLHPERQMQGSCKAAPGANMA